MIKLILCVALIGAICPLGSALKKRPDVQIQPVLEVDDAAPIAEPESPVDSIDSPVKEPVKLIRKPIRRPKRPIDGSVNPIRGPVLPIADLVDPIEGNVEPEQPIDELVDPIDGYIKPGKPVEPELAILPAIIPKRSCPKACNYFAKCSPYYKSYIYTIVNGRCRIYQNSCIFGMENCSRANRCSRPMKQVSQKVCRLSCKRLCKPIGDPVCASFPVTNEDGTSEFESISFANRCELDRYACLADHAYVYEPVDGACA